MLGLAQRMLSVLVSKFRSWWKFINTCEALMEARIDFCLFLDGLNVLCPLALQ
jgi:hypothetical protein